MERGTVAAVTALRVPALPGACSRVSVTGLVSARVDVATGGRLGDLAARGDATRVILVKRARRPSTRLAHVRTRASL